jgi:hypothetical protein
LDLLSTILTQLNEHSSEISNWNEVGKIYFQYIQSNKQNDINIDMNTTSLTSFRSTDSNSTSTIDILERTSRSEIIAHILRKIASQQNKDEQNEIQMIDTIDIQNMNQLQQLCSLANEYPTETHKLQALTEQSNAILQQFA